MQRSPLIHGRVAKVLLFSLPWRDQQQPGHRLVRRKVVFLDVAEPPVALQAFQIFFRPGVGHPAVVNLVAPVKGIHERIDIRVS